MNTSLIQFLVYPEFFKINFLVYLECDFSTFYIHGIFWQAVRILVYSIVGKNINSVESFYQGYIGSKTETFEALNFLGFQIVASIFITLYLILLFSNGSGVEIQTEQKNLKAALKSVNSKTMMKEVDSIKTNQLGTKSLITN